MTGSSWYFGYGANMARRVLARRGITILESQPARLPEHELTFEEPGIPYVEPVFAVVSPAAGESVHGVLHRISDADLAQLDQFEGLGYDRAPVRVEGRECGEVHAFLYVSRRRVRAKGRRPSRRYVGLLIAGAREHDLPAHWIERLEAEPTFHAPLVGHVLPLVLRGMEQLQKRSPRFDRWIRRFAASQQ